MCHGLAKPVTAGLDLRTLAGVMAGGVGGAVVVPGNPDASRLWMLVRDGKMPVGGVVTDEEKQLIREWIEKGQFPSADQARAEKRNEKINDKAREWWSFKKPVKPPVPAVRNAAKARNPIDAFVLQKLEDKKWTFNPEADKRTLVRRVYLDLLGLPPTPEQLNEFLSDTKPDAYARLIDRLLESPHYGEQWGRRWLDVAGYSDSIGNSTDEVRTLAWRYRDWVIRALNQDKPYNEFLMEQFAGDQIVNYNYDTKPRPEDIDKLTATGFLRVAPDYGDQQPIYQVDKYYDALQATMETSLKATIGIQLACARCHDHKFDPIPTSDYYALAGILRSTRTITSNIAGPLSGWNRRLLDPSPENAKALADWKAQVEKARVRLVALRDRKAAVAEARALELTLARLKAEVGTNDEEIRRLEAELKKKKAVAPVRDEEVAARESDMAHALLGPKPAEALAVEDEKKPADLRIHIRGDARNPGAPAPRGFLRSLPVEGARGVDPASSGRLQLAEWITHPDNPLPARVWANRVWLHLMGSGLVRTPDNFGTRGEAPTHPELLDYLACRLRDGNGSLKTLVREIVSSRSYRMASRGGATDPENRLLGRRDLRRLDAEALRDAMLAIAGELDPTRGGSTMTYSGRLFVPLESIPLPVDPWRRRAVYLPIYRGATPPDLLDVFDFAPPGLVTGRRASTTVPTQALFLMNSPFVLDRSRALARSLLARPGLDDRARLDLLYRMVFSRRPTEAQSRRASAFLNGGGEEAWTDLAQALFSSNEFLFLE